MKTIAFDKIPASDWNDLAQASPDAWLMHRAEWIVIETRFFVRKNLCFGIYVHDRLVGIQPLYLSDGSNGTSHGEILVHSGIHRHAGLALSPSLSRAETIAAQNCTMQLILHVAHSLGADRIQLNAHNLAPRNLSSNRDHIPYWVVDHGFQLGLGFGPNGMEPAPGFSVCNADQIVDLSQSEEVLFSELDEACRRAVRKAEKAGLKFVVETAEDRLERYFALAKSSALRTGEALPPLDYYQAILDQFSKSENVITTFARLGDNDVAALILLTGKGAASFLAGVSDPGSLSMRPNDFIHWQAILWAKSMKFMAYRFGPIFPEVPSDWPIAKVSAFKGRFGARPVPMIQGSLFLNTEHAQKCLALASQSMTALAYPRKLPTPPAVSLAADNVAHHMRLFGMTGASSHPDQTSILVADAAVEGGWIAARQAVDAGKPVVLLRPSRAAAFLEQVAFEEGDLYNAPVFNAVNAGENEVWRHLRSLHANEGIAAKNGMAVVQSPSGVATWVWLPIGKAGMLLVGTELHRDLIRLRQGDPAAAANRPTEAQWGIAGERPTYLFEGQLEADKPHDRMADWWMWTLRDALIRHAGVTADDILPFGAKGVVIITGDDDQAPLEDYRAQEKLLGGLPVTYFLHPLTKHTRQSMVEHSLGRSVEWEIHPDALETPGEYNARFDEQAAWFEALTGRPPRLVRNHGYLNDGYWGHAKAWIRHGVTGSSNLPGVDCRVLNSSLLPARLALNGKMTDHWSILTAFGDGVMFIFEWDDATAMRAIHDAEQRILDSGVPGILVFNLHPANHEKAASMHAAVRKLVEDGFAAMTLGAALEWFKARDAGLEAVVSAGMVAPFALPEAEATIPSATDNAITALPMKTGRSLWKVARSLVSARRHS
jgi:Acetyltransferase (GNAT) domain